MSFGSAITAVFGADTAPLAKGATEAEGIVGGFASKASAALGALGLTLGAGAIMGFFKSVIDKGGALADLSARLEVGTDELQAFDYAVRLAGGSTEQANAVWDKSRKALDSLAAGQESAVKQFAALGLNAADFIGLDLPASLEKITRGYAENKDAAGSYDAITDILGTKTAPQLNTVLLNLAAEGFPAFTAAAKAAGQVIDSEAIARMDEFGDRLDTLKGRLTTWGATVFNVIGKAFDGVGAGAAMLVNAFDGVETSINRADFIAEKADATIKKVLPALTQTTEQLKAQKDIQAERTKFEDIIAKAALEQLAPAAKLAELKRQMATHAAEAVAAGDDELAMQKAMNAQATLAVEYRKLSRAEQEKLTAAMRLGKDDELEYARLMVKGTQNLTYEEGLRLNVLKLQQTELKNQYETKQILAKGVENLTAADKTRLAELFRQKTLIAEQVEGINAEITATQRHRTAAEGVTAELDRQVEKVKSLKAEWASYSISVSRTGTGYTQQSTTALEGLRDRLTGQLSDPSPNSGRAIKDATQGQDYGAWLMASTLKAELTGIENELATRRSVAAYARQYGEQAAVYKFGDDLTNRALADLNSTQQRTATAIESIAKGLKTAGL